MDTMDTKERTQIIKDLATSPGFLQALIACSHNIEGRKPNMVEIGLWFYSSGYFDSIEFQKKQSLTSSSEVTFINELKMV